MRFVYSLNFFVLRVNQSRPAIVVLLALLGALGQAACGGPSSGASRTAQDQLALAATAAVAGLSTSALTPSPPRPGLAGTSAVATATPSRSAPPTATLASPATDVPPPPTARPLPTGALRGEKAEGIDFVELYSGASLMGPILSDKAKTLDGKTVTMKGYMAPPLKPDLDFFILTQEPMVFCPFCNSAADWPFNIVFVRMAGGKTVPPLVPTQSLRVTGTFSVGVATDEATGFVSLVRIYADSIDVLR